MKVILVAPGPRHSTYDVYMNYAKALKKHPEIDLVTFPYHNIMDWHKGAQIFLTPDVDNDDMDNIAVSRASRELLGDIGYHNPDIVLFVAGTAYPMPLYAHIKKMQHSFKNPFALGIYLTESPYLDEIQAQYLKIIDFAYINELSSVKKFDPEGNRYILYLPHSYNSDVHNTVVDYEDVKTYERDVFFCGTPFYERQELLASVDWDGIDLALAGLWDREYVDKDFYRKLQPYVFHDGPMDNDIVTRYYRHSKVSINIHRTRPDIEGISEPLKNNDIYSTGPRPFEVVASGGFLVTDYRQELWDIFGDTILYFDDTESFKNSIQKALAMSDEEREDMASAARERVAACTFDNRVAEHLFPIFKELEELRWQKS